MILNCFGHLDCVRNSYLKSQILKSANSDILVRQPEDSFFNDKISDEKNLKISNVLKRPKMRFSAPKAPKIFRDPEINKNPPLVNGNLSARGNFYLKFH